MKKSRKIRIVIAVILFIIGFSVLAYPFMSNLWNQYRNEKLITQYSETVGEIDRESLTAMWEEAEAYNAQHTQNVIMDAFNGEDYVLSHPYDQMLNPTGNEVMGSISIPKINVNLPIYHGIGAEALEQGCGHVEGTSLPVGGIGTHSVLAGHRGLPSAKLFTDLDQMEIGDVFSLSILDETLTYEVDQIKTVLPQETEDLAIDENEDYVTLITCTPYGVNTHRLLVRGHRIPNPEAEEEIVSSEINSMELSQKTIILIFAGGVALFLVLFLLILKKKKKS